MGGVCSSGKSKKRNSSKLEAEELHQDHRKTSSGFSGKLKSMKSFGGKQNKNDDFSFKYPDLDSFEKASSNPYDSAELRLSISRELKPSTPARTGTPAKV